MSQGSYHQSELELLLKTVAALPMGAQGLVGLLVETPSPGVHEARRRVLVAPGNGFCGDHPGKSFYKGRFVAGREVAAVSLEILEALGVDPQTVGDNLMTRGFDLGALEPGQCIEVGEAVLERSPKAHRVCTVFLNRSSSLAYAVMSRGRNRGALFTVRKGGTIRVNDEIRCLDF